MCLYVCLFVINTHHVTKAATIYTAYSRHILIAVTLLTMIGKLKYLSEVFDYIRMLDADTYPPAFLDKNNLHIEFTRASLKDGHILADAKIFIKH